MKTQRTSARDIVSSKSRQEPVYCLANQNRSSDHGPCRNLLSLRGYDVPVRVLLVCSTQIGKALCRLRLTTVVWAGFRVFHGGNDAGISTRLYL
jgi:hypothetical protein